ncbi:hypothetical protein GCM10028791_37500 [Echinicola sediminis]
MFTACVEDELITYDQKDNVYFLSSTEDSVFGNVTDSLLYSFGLMGEDFTDSIINVQVAVMGVAKDYDRPVNIQVSANSSAQDGVDFEIVEAPIVKAGEFVANVPVRLYKSEEGKTDTLMLGLNLLPNEHFDTKMQQLESNNGEVILSHVNLSVHFTSSITQPKGWFTPYFGTFSVKKILLMAEVLDIDPYAFTKPLGSVYSVSEYQFFGVYMQRYLDVQEANGNPIYEEDGTLMEMGSLI